AVENKKPGRSPGSPREGTQDKTGFRRRGCRTKDVGHAHAVVHPQRGYNAPLVPASLQHITASTPMGANLVADGATFRVWAPNATSVNVRGRFNQFAVRDAALLVNDAGYWHGFIAGVAEGATYKYWVTGPAGPG